jgi:hypothetical protein
MVEREVERTRARRIREDSLRPREILDALESARQQQNDLAVLVPRLEELHP